MNRFRHFKIGCQLNTSFAGLIASANTLAPFAMLRMPERPQRAKRLDAPAASGVSRLDALAAPLAGFRMDARGVAEADSVVLQSRP